MVNKTFAAALLMLAAAFHSTAGAVGEVVRASHVPVFAKGTYGSRYYRIPAITTAADGSLVALADRRIDRISDLPGRIDITSRRSVDNGLTWSEPVIVAANDSVGGYGDAAIVCDRLSGDILAICAHGNGLWQDAPAHIALIRSRDNGVSWDSPRDITPMIAATIPGGADNVAGWFATSGGALQLDNGRLLFALVVRYADRDNFDVYSVYSDDGGLSWRVGSKPATDDGDESKAVQLSDGSLLMSIRNRYKGPRKFARSCDGGDTWARLPSTDDLPDPACNGDIIRLADGRLAQSLPSRPGARADVAVYISGDNGATWPERHIIVNANSSYSAMTPLPDGRVGILIEEEAPDGDGFIITYTDCDF